MTTVTRVQSNIFDSGAAVLVNPVNTVGVMGAGLALDFKRRFPEIWEPYKGACTSGEIVPGRVQIVPIHQSGATRFVINFPTKEEWREPSRLPYIRTGLEDMVPKLAKLDPDHGWPGAIAIPALGCGLGGLLWGDVEPLILNAFHGWSDEVHVLLYPPRWETPR